MNLQWYTRRDEADVEKGPFERAALVKAVRQGEVRRDTQVRREDQVEWSTLGDHPAFRAGLAGWRPGDPEDDEIPGIGASPLLWLAALAAFALQVIISIAFSNGKDGAERAGVFLGTVLGSLIWPFVIVAISSLWKSNRTPKRRLKVFFIASVALVILQLGPALVIVGMRGYIAATPSWEYRSQEHGFSLVLPAQHWKQSAQKTHLIDFSSSLGPPMLAGVMSVEKHSLQEFRKFVPVFKTDLKIRSNLLTSPEFQEGETESGNQYVFATYREEGPYTNQVLYKARSLVWLKDKGITVTIVFEGKREGSGKVSGEDSYFETAARAICLSVK